MAEAFGIAAGILGVLQLTGKVASIGYGYVGGVKRASKDIAQLLKELGSLTCVLTTLEDYAATNPHSPALAKLDGKDGPIQGCLRDLKSLQEKLEPRDGLKGIIDSLKWPLKDTETIQFIANIERNKTLFTLALAADHIALTKEIEVHVKNTDRVVQALQIESTDRRQKEEILRTEEEHKALEERREKVLSWLSPNDFGKKHYEISNKRQKNTGKWLLEKLQAHPHWNKGTSSSRLLWGFGIPGAGKTFLSSGVIDHLQDQAITKNYGVAYIYFDYMERDQQRPAEILSSLIKQLLGQTPGPSLPTKVKELYDKKKKNIEELFDALLETFKQFSQVFLIFDALDECDPNNQRVDLLPLLHNLGESGANIFVTSRQYPEDIQQSFKDVSRLEISAQGEDIEIYIRQKIRNNARASRLIQRARCEDKIISGLISCAQGMFLLVYFHIEYLCQQTTAKQLLTAIERLENSSTKERPLFATYDKAMEVLMNQSESSTELGLLVLSWLVKAKRTLTIEEIQVAVSIEPDRYELDELDLPEETTILDVCAGLVMIEENSRNIRLVHYTVQEYLVEKSIVLKDIDFRLAMACITYLSFDIFAQYKYSPSPLPPFMDYAANNLSYHLRTCDEDASVGIVLRFLGSQGNLSFYKEIDDEYYFIEGSKIAKRWSNNKSAASPLITAIELGHLTAFQLLLDKAGPKEISNKNHYGLTALHVATLERNKTIFQLLLDKGANCSIQDKNGRTVVFYAVAKGYSELVQLLIENGTDLSIQSHLEGTPLHSAVQRGNLELVQILLKNGADLSTKNYYGETPLYIAAQYKYLKLAQMLTKNGADPSAPNNRGETPLYVAARNGDLELAQLLIENGADLSTPNRRGQTLLYAATQGENIELAQMLIRSGADLSTPNYVGETPLYAAVHRGNLELAQMFVENGADLSTPNLYGETPLYVAAQWGCLELAQMLIENGADLSTQDNDGVTPLFAATQNKHLEVVRLLIMNGAE